MHSIAKNWNFEISVSAQMDIFFKSPDLTASEGYSETETDSDTSTTTTWDKFIFDLDAPACSIVKGNIRFLVNYWSDTKRLLSVTKEQSEQNIGHVFEIDGHQVTINGRRILSNTISQKYEVAHIEKVCITRDAAQPN